MEARYVGKSSVATSLTRPAAMQIQYNITRIEEWCQSKDMPEGTLQLEHLMQATKLLQLKKASLGDIEIIFDVCWMLTPTQIQKLISHFYVADYEVRRRGVWDGRMLMFISDTHIA